ncbi:hypothetical protein AB3U99_23995 [Niallia sp. JL1B1071]|uniref:hypothetical protein n=1 Tax=Niallia tiangongensis TaxID=3237105 RepID=UPI0037DDBB64
MLGDTAYSGTENLQFAHNEGFQLVSRLHPVITNKKREEDDFVFNKDTDMFTCPAGHLAVKKKIKNRKEGDNRNPQLSYYFDVENANSVHCKKGVIKA